MNIVAYLAYNIPPENEDLVKRYIDSTTVNTETGVPYVFDELIKNITLDFVIVTLIIQLTHIFDIPKYRRMSSR